MSNPTALAVSSPPSPGSIQLNLARNVAERVYRLLEKHLKPTEGSRTTPLFYIWPRPSRAILIFDPASFKDPRLCLETRFAARLAAGLGNRKVAVTLHEALYIQVSYVPRPLGKQTLPQVPLDLSQQPGPLYVPIGTDHKGSRWHSLLAMDSVLIGGARRMGKTRVLHGFIQALLRGGRAELWLWDGKNGVEFGRYQHLAGARVVATEALGAALTDLSTEMVRRQQLFQAVGVASLPEYNQQAAQPLPLLVPLLDELALMPETVQTALGKLIALGGAFGIHPVVATQRPDAAHIQGLLKSNLATRIALPVPDHQTSKIILGQTGAEKLPKTKGRMLLVWNARLVEVQAFHIELGTAPGEVRPRLSLLTPDEYRLVKSAAEDAEGWFKIRELAARTGQGRDTVNMLAKEWETLGYLTPVQRNENGHPLGRRVTPKLLEAAGIGGSGEGADRAD